MPKSAQEIISVAEKRFGANCQPKALILTHGHFDHVGAIIDLIDHWGMPVYAHALELPFLTGKENYPEPDPNVNGGLIAKISSIFPNEAINLGRSCWAASIGWQRTIYAWFPLDSYARTYARTYLLVS